MRVKTISLDHVEPEVFSGREPYTSDVWNCELHFEKGKSYLIESLSGGGKSSLCSYIYGFRSDYRGNILFDQQNIRLQSESDLNEIRQNHLSMLFQGLRLFPELSALENIRIKNELTGFNDDTWIELNFEKAGLADKKDTPVALLSFGQQQRVALLRSFCQPFDFLILDEPVSHLDEINGKRVGEMIREEVARQGAGLIITTIGKHPQMEFDNILHL